MQNSMRQCNRDIHDFSQLCQTNCIIKKKDQNNLMPIKIAYRPYQTTKQFYDKLAVYTKIWQKLIYLASKQQNFIQNVYQQTKKNDPFVSRLLDIRKIKKQKNLRQKLDFIITRTDYFINLDNLPKIIQINLFSVSMYCHMQNCQNVKKTYDILNTQKYIDNRPNEHIISSVAEIYKQHHLKGIFIYLVDENQKNIMQQRKIMFELLKHKIVVRKLTLVQAGQKLQLDNDNNLILEGQLVSFVLFRVGYTLNHYKIDQKLTWKARQTIQLSNAIKIPSIKYDLMNLKRMQVQLSKKQIYSKYLNEDQIKLFQQTLVPVWQFDHMSDQQFQKLIKILEANPDHYVMKPNLQGGGNNIYKQKVLETLKTLNKQQRKNYILMQLIDTKPIQNIIVCGDKNAKAECLYEISHYGVVVHDQQKLIKNQQVGFLIRIKPKNENQGGILQGAGSLCSWMIQQNNQ